jgi:hypothetical protein
VLDTDTVSTEIMNHASHELDHITAQHEIQWPLFAEYYAWKSGRSRHFSNDATGHQELELDTCNMLAWLLCSNAPHLDLMIDYARRPWHNFAGNYMYFFPVAGV